MSLKGKYCIIYTNGGWEFDGEVIDEEEDTITLKQDDDALVIYRASIIAAKLLSEQKRLKPEVVRPKQEKNNEQEELEEENEGSSEWLGSFIPADMLLEKIKEDNTVFSMSMASLKNIENKVMAEEKAKNDIRK